MSLWGDLFCPKCTQTIFFIFNGILFILVILKNNTFAKRLPAFARVGPHDKKIIEIIYGSLLGDGHAEKRVIGHGTRISFYQEARHREYLF